MRVATSDRCEMMVMEFVLLKMVVGFDCVCSGSDCSSFESMLLVESKGGIGRPA